jgi:hypothetical protein
MDGLNMSKITRIQQSYRWQPHLPFTQVHLESHPWAKRYCYKYDTLPIMQVEPNQWTLDPFVASTWSKHITFFSNILSTWRHHLSMAPMTVDYLPSIQDYQIDRRFNTEKQARGYFWYFRTLIFTMFAEFSFTAAGKINWRDSVIKFCVENTFEIEEIWLNQLENALCDFTRTKRAGVIINVATTKLWSILPRYHQNGVPVLMDVGHILFHDHDPEPKLPTIFISNVTGVSQYDKYPNDWPLQPELVRKTRAILEEFYPGRLGTGPRPQIPLLTLSRWRGPGWYGTSN